MGKDRRTIIVPVRTASAEHRVRGSRFLALARPATSMKAALEIRDHERRRLHDATHWVWACRLRAGDSRFDDDGEPSGTGGRPILSSIDGRGVVDVVVVVTRYFGGTKLGTGGLARAYGSAAERVLDELPVRHMLEAEQVELRFPYPDTGTVQRLVERHEGRRLGEAFGEKVVLTAAIPSDRLDDFTARLRDATADRVSARSMRVTMLVPVRS